MASVFGCLCSGADGGKADVGDLPKTSKMVESPGGISPPGRSQIRA
jgi:hypothetical protein